MPKKNADGRLGPARYSYFPKEVDEWLLARAEAEERTLAWIIRQAVIENYNRETAFVPRRRSR